MISMWRDDTPADKNPLRFFLFVTRPHWKAASAALAAVVVASILYSLIPYVFKLIADAAAGLPAEGAYRDLVLACVIYIVILFIAQLLWRVSGFAGARWAMDARATARYALTSYVTLHSRAFFSERFAGSIANKISHAGNAARDAVELGLWQFLQLIVSVIASFFVAYTVSPLVALIFLGWTLAVVVFNVYFARKRVPLSVHSQGLETRLNGATVDLMTNVSAMQEYGRRFFEIDRLKGVIEKRRFAGLRNWHFGEWVLVANGFMQTFFAAAMVFAALYLAWHGAISPGDVILVLTVIFHIEGLLLFMGQHLNRFGEVWGEMQESLDEIIEPHEIPDAPDAAELAVPRGEIVFDDVTFHYEEIGVFRNLNLRIGAGERIGLVGKSGAGKSTLMRLLLRHHDIDAGAIEIDGANIARVAQESLRRNIAVVPQEPLLFHRTIRENIAYGNPGASEDEIGRAATMAEAHDFIVRLPGGYDSLVGERGVKLSGGERQRIVIARAILKNARILLLDEATSALDSESEVAIQSALHELMKGKTVIAIAHRLSTLREMDRIIVLDEGRIVEDGSHEELIARGGAYAALWSHQAGGFIPDE